MKGKKILSVLLSLVLVLSIVFAVEGKAKAAEEKVTVKSEATEFVAGAAVSKETDGLMKAVTKRQMSPEFYATSVLNSSTKVSYIDTVLPSYTYTVIPITAKSTGYMWFNYEVEGIAGTTSQITIEVTDYENALLFDNYAGSVDYGSYTNTQQLCMVGDEVKNKGPLYAEKGDTYYAIICNWGDEGQADVTVSLGAKVYTTGSRTLYQGTSKWTYASGVNKSGKSSTTWFKVKPDKSGVMTVSLKEYGYSSASGTIRLYNSSKKTALSNSVNGSKAYFGVKKGTTYYLKVTNCAGTASNNYKYGIKYGMTSRTDRDLNSKSEAKKLTRKADATNTLFKASTSTSSSATTDWYKIYVSSKRKTRITINNSGMSSGEVDVTLYKGSTKIGTGTIKAGYKGTFKITTNYSDYATKGTYYIKIKKSKMCSGKYSIRYDQ